MVGAFALAWDRRTGMTKRERWALHFVLALALLVSLLPHGTMAASAAPALPLTQVAAAQSNQTVQALVGHAGSADELTALVSHLGGEIVQDLHIIQAFAVRLPATAVPRLAQAGEVRWIRVDGAVESAADRSKPKTPAAGNTYLQTLGVPDVWAMGIDGSGITVATIDSGIATTHDFSGKAKHTGAGGASQGNRILEQLSFNSSLKKKDSSGHGTHVAGIIGGTGAYVDGAYAGIAPGVNFVSLNISNSEGMAYESDAVAAMQWVLEHKDQYNIRVVNLSINSTTEMSYHASPLAAAAEILWFNGIVVVASAGNRQDGLAYNTVKAAPANDPFIITVGASDEAGTVDTGDDTVTTFSAYGTTLDGFAKPDILAPGKDIYSVLAPYSDWGRLYPERVDASGKYFRASGTSMAAPMVAGAVALLLQDEPHLTPDQVKYRLLHTGSTIPGNSNDTNEAQTYPYLHAYRMVTGATIESANTGIKVSQLLTTGDEPIWDSVSWNSVSWNSVSWNSVSWNSVSWNSVSWNSVIFSSVHWNN